MGSLPELPCRGRLPTLPANITNAIRINVIRTNVIETNIIGTNISGTNVYGKNVNETMSLEQK